MLVQVAPCIGPCDCPGRCCCCCLHIKNRSDLVPCKMLNPVLDLCERSPSYGVPVEPPCAWYLTTASRHHLTPTTPVQTANKIQKSLQPLVVEENVEAQNVSANTHAPISKQKSIPTNIPRTNKQRNNDCSNDITCTLSYLTLPSKKEK